MGALVLGLVAGASSQSWADETGAGSGTSSTGTTSTSGTGASGKSESDTGTSDTGASDTSTSDTSASGTSHGEESAAEIKESLDEAKGIPEFHKLRTPHAPAFVILGVAPAEIQRPSTPVDFAIALNTDLRSGTELTLPRNMAIEVAPYWWWSHKTLTFDDYLAPSWWENIARNTSLSIGTSSKDTPLIVMGEEMGTITETRLGLGLSTQFYTGVSPADICSGKVQQKAATLAALLIKELSGDEEEAALELRVVAAEQQAWEDLLPRLSKRADAATLLAQANAVLQSPTATAEARERARASKASAEAAIADVDKELEALVQRSKEMARAMEEAHDKARANKTRPDRTQAEGDASSEEAIAAARKRAADRVVEVLSKWRSLTVAEARKGLDDAKARLQALNRQREESHEKRKERQLAENEKRLQEIVELCQDTSAARVGWNIAAAGALAVLFPESRFSNGDLTGLSGWLTVSYTAQNGLSLSSMVRVAWHELDDATRDTVFDVGGRLIKARNRYAFSGELIGRFFTEEFDGWRAGISGEYMLRKGTWFSLSFGKDFSSDDDIFTLANLNWGFGGESGLQKQIETP